MLKVGCRVHALNPSTGTVVGPTHEGRWISEFTEFYNIQTYIVRPLLKSGEWRRHTERQRDTDSKLST